MTFLEDLRQLGKIAWVGWTAGMVAMAIYVLDTGNPIEWNMVMYFTAGFALVSIAAALSIQIHERYASHFTP